MSMHIERWVRWAFLFLAVVCPGLVAGPVLAQWAGPGSGRPQRPEPDRSREVLVRFRGGSPIEQARNLLNALGGVDIRSLPRCGAYAVQAAGAEGTDRLLASLRADSRVLWAQVNGTRRLRGIPNDTLFDYAWHLHNQGQTGGTPDADVDASEAWDLTEGADDVLVAITDTGIQNPTGQAYGLDTGHHPDLETRIWTNEAEALGVEGVDDDGNGLVDDVYGWNFAYNENVTDDFNGHGTHVAGIVAAEAGNAEGSAGVAPRVKLLPVAVLDDAGNGYDSSIAEGIRYAVDMGARVINASWGGPGESPIIEEAIDYAAAHGVLFVCAAGNESSDNDAAFDMPASYRKPNLISVAATDHRDALAAFSNYGATTVDLAAPGVDILSSVPEWTVEEGYLPQPYYAMGGTSMASPIVAGVAALVLSVDPARSAEEVRGIVLQGVDPLDVLVGRVATGGRVNARSSVDLAQSGPQPGDPADGPEDQPEPDPDAGTSDRIVIEPIANVTMSEGEARELMVFAFDQLRGEPVFVSAQGLPDGGAYPDDLMGGFIELVPDYTVVQGEDARTFQVTVRAELHSGEYRTATFQLTIANDASIGEGLAEIVDYYRGLAARIRTMIQEYEEQLAPLWLAKAADYEAQADAWRQLAGQYPEFAADLEAAAAKYAELAGACRRVAEYYQYLAREWLPPVANFFDAVAGELDDIADLYL